MINTYSFCESVCLKAKQQGFTLLFKQVSDGYVHRWQHPDIGVMPMPLDRTHVSEPKVALFIACQDLATAMGWHHS